MEILTTKYKFFLRGILLTILLEMFLLNNSFGDSDRHDVEKRQLIGKCYSITHTINWDKYLTIYHPPSRVKEFDLYSDSNDFSVIKLVDMKSGDTILKTPVPVFTKIIFGDHERLIVGLSTQLKYNNQVTLINHKGEVIYSRHIAPFEYKMNHRTICIFKDSFPNEFEELVNKERVYNLNESYYIDIIDVLSISSSDSAQRFLIKHADLSENHLVATKFAVGIPSVYFYNQRKVKVKVKKDFFSRDYTAIKILGIDNKYFELCITENKDIEVCK